MTTKRRATRSPPRSQLARSAGLRVAMVDNGEQQLLHQAPLQTSALIIAAALPLQALLLSPSVFVRSGTGAATCSCSCGNCRWVSGADRPVVAGAVLAAATTDEQ